MTSNDGECRLKSDSISVWPCLEHFLCQLQQSTDSGRQIQLTLETIRETTNAEAAFWFWGANRQDVTVVADDCLPTNWCRHVARTLLVRAADGPDRLLCPEVFRISMPHDWVPIPQSAALIRVSKSRAAWIVALSFDADKPLGETDLAVMHFAKRLLTRQRAHAKLYESLKSTLFGLIQSFTTAIDAKDPYTSGHSERVARMAVRLGEQIGLDERELSQLYLAGLLHDIGKIGIRDDVLSKPAALDPDEIAHVQQHPVIGGRILAGIQQLEHLRPGVRNHHERFDGNGYPDQLVGKTSPLIARILAVVDACDAMMSARPYRPAMPAEKIDAIMEEGAGTQWDPEIVEEFMRCRDDLYPISRKGIGESVIAAVERSLTDSDTPSSLCV